MSTLFYAAVVWLWLLQGWVGFAHPTCWLAVVWSTVFGMICLRVALADDVILSMRPKVENGYDRSWDRFYAREKFPEE